MEWETVIGLEVHAQLKTATKIFSRSSTKYGAMPNTQACIIDLGMPGVLPVLNTRVIDMAIKLGLAIDANIATKSVFARKNYFYPDLPKGYQISQFELPIVEGGQLEITLKDGTTKIIGVTRAHLEEDAGKSLHDDFDGKSGIDLNRAGTPLLEIVSEPDMRSSEEAIAYLKSLHTLVKYLEICDGNMQEGSFRCDANVSIRPLGQKELGTRCEIKNINSFRFVEKAIHYEVARHIDVLTEGGKIHQETRLYDSSKNETRSMRSKEEAHDYRYFPDPDLLPVRLTPESIETIRDTLPELPGAKKHRFMASYGLNAYDASVLISQRETADYFEKVADSSEGDAKLVSNWITGELAAYLNKHNLDISDCPIPAEQMAHLTDRIADATISGKIAKSVFEALWAQEGSVDDIIEKKGLKQITDNSEIERIITLVMANNPNQLEQYLSGKDKLFGFFVGQVMKETGGKANPQGVNKLLKEMLK